MENEIDTLNGILKEIDKKCDIDNSHLPFLLGRFSEYERFVQSFYKNSGVTDTRSNNPARNMLFPINNRFNLILLNTALASCNDQCGENREIIDLHSIAKLAESNNNRLPSLVVAHHNPYNIHRNQQITLRNLLNMLNVKAWICGDEHITESLPSHSRNYLGEPDIPILVCGKSVIQDGDPYSNNSVIYYELNNNGITIRVFDYYEGQSEANGFHESPRYHNTDSSPLVIPLDTYDSFHADNDGNDISNKPQRVVLPNDGIEHYKKSVKNELLLPWLYGEEMSFDAIFPRLFVNPIMKSEKKLVRYSKIDSLLQSCCDKNIIITGDAGIGKSTLLKYVFLFCQIPQTELLYVKANAICNTSNGDKPIEYLNYINSVINGYPPRVKTIILLDGIDEAYPDKEELLELFQKIRYLKDVHIWFGWRREHLYRNKNETINQIIADIICVQEWDIKKAKKYVRKYSRICNRKEIYKSFIQAIKENKQIRSFSQNPFKLTLLIYLIKNSTVLQQNSFLFSLFSLYESFIDVWIEKEGSIKNKNEIVDFLIVCAKQLYYNCSPCEVKNDSAVIRDLFHFIGHDQAYEFCHRSLASFFIAKNRLDKLVQGGQELLDELYVPMMSDVTEFINTATSYYWSHRDTVMYNLMSLYETIQQNSTNKDASLRQKNGIVYLITRLSLGKQIVEEFIRRIKDEECDARMRVTIAFGAATLGMQDVTLEFAKEFYDSDSIIEKVTRSFSLIYYKDVDQEDFFNYQDDGTAPWTKSREIRLKNLLSSKRKDISFRILDIPVLFFFYRSRGWHDVKLKDYLILMLARIDKHLYSSDVYDFLIEKMSELKSEYRKHLVKHFFASVRLLARLIQGIIRR